MRRAVVSQRIFSGLGGGRTAGHGTGGKTAVGAPYQDVYKRQQQGFQFENFRPQVMDVDRPLPHIRLDAALEFLIGDKLR